MVKSVLVTVFVGPLPKGSTSPFAPADRANKVLKSLSRKPLLAGEAAAARSGSSGTRMRKHVSPMCHPISPRPSEPWPAISSDEPGTRCPARSSRIRMGPSPRFSPAAKPGADARSSGTSTIRGSRCPSIGPACRSSARAGSSSASGASVSCAWMPFRSARRRTRAADLIAQSLVNDETLPVPSARGNAAGRAVRRSRAVRGGKLVLESSRPGGQALASTSPPEPEPAEQTRPAEKPAQTSGLSNAERSAFREIARALGARLEEDTPSSE